MQPNKIAYVKRHDTATFFSGKIQLGFIRQTQPLDFAGMNGVVTAFAKNVSQNNMNIFVKKKPQLHFA